MKCSFLLVIFIALSFGCSLQDSEPVPKWYLVRHPEPMEFMNETWMLGSEWTRSFQYRIRVGDHLGTPLTDTSFPWSGCTPVAVANALGAQDYVARGYEQPCLLRYDDSTVLTNSKYPLVAWAGMGMRTVYGTDKSPTNTRDMIRFLKSQSDIVVEDYSLDADRAVQVVFSDGIPCIFNLDHDGNHHTVSVDGYDVATHLIHIEFGWGYGIDPAHAYSSDSVRTLGAARSGWFSLTTNADESAAANGGTVIGITSSVVARVVPHGSG